MTSISCHGDQNNVYSSSIYNFESFRCFEFTEVFSPVLWDFMCAHMCAYVCMQGRAYMSAYACVCVCVYICVCLDVSVSTYANVGTVEIKD